MTIGPKISRNLITLLSDSDDPASVSKAIDLILSVPTGMHRICCFISSMSMAPVGLSPMRRRVRRLR